MTEPHDSDISFGVYLDAFHLWPMVYRVCNTSSFYTLWGTQIQPSVNLIRSMRLRERDFNGN